jgi:hypothetical protein
MNEHRPVFPKFFNSRSSFDIYIDIHGIRNQIWPRKIFTGPHILAHVNIERPDDWQPKLEIYISDLILDRYE